MPEPHQPQLTDDELKYLRTIMDQDKYVRRFWASVRTWVIAIAAVVAAITVGFDAIGKFIRFFAGK